jgi:hypothetical protein
VNVERVLPANAVRPLWSSASALVYLGAFVALFATFALLAISSDDGGDWALVGASLVAFVAAVGLAVLLERAERAIAAGVAATLAVVFASVLVGSLLNAFGALEADVGDYQPATLVVEAAVIAASVAAIIRFRAPLLVLPGALAFWFVITDLGSLFSWDDAGELLSVAAGVLLAAAGVVADRAGRQPFGFWLHAIGGLAAGGGIAVLAGDSGWFLIALIALGFVALAFALGRSSYAVLGAIGILIATTLFAVEPLSIVGGFLPFGAPPSGDGLEGWQIALSYLVAGLGLAAIGVAGRLWRLPRSGPIAGHE